MITEEVKIQEDWKNALSNLKNIYSDAQIAVVLGLSHSAVAGRLNKFSYTSYEDKILDINNKLNNNPPQNIFFLEWCDRLFKNEYALTYRAIRQSLRLSNKELGFLEKRNLGNYENSNNLMPKHLFDKFLDYFDNKKLEYNIERINKYKTFVKNQIKDFLNNKFYLKCPSIIKIFPPIDTTKGIEKEYEVYNKLKENYPNTFIGCTFSNDLRRKDDIDILVIENDDVIIFEVKDFKKYKTTFRRRLRDLNSHLRRLKRDYEEITKTIAILPSINVSKEIKDQFNKNDNLLLDKKEFDLFLNGKLVIKKEGYNDKIKDIRSWLNRFEISEYMLQILFDMNKINITVRNLRRKIRFDKAIDDLKFIEKILTRYNKRKLHFLVNKYASLRNDEILFLRNLRKLAGISLSDLCLEWFGDRNKNKNHLARIETGKRILKWLREKYKEHLLTNIKDKSLIVKAKESVIKEKRRWEIAKEFPMVVGFANGENNKFENYIAKIMIKRGYEIVQNALINDVDLTKMTLNFQHPEADIIAKKKDNSYILISCKEALEKPKNSQFYVRLKSELDRLFDYKEDIEFSKAILAVKADLSDQTWRTLENYAKKYKVEVWRVDKDAF